jgi:capsular exopolysaccharide synthesis family protein
VSIESERALINSEQNAVTPYEAPQRISIPISDHEGFTVREYFRVAKKYRWLIVLVSIVFFILTALYSFLATPLYVASATVEIGTYLPLLPTASVEAQVSQQTQSSGYLSTQIARIKSLTVADRALNDKPLAEAINTYFSRADGLFSEPKQLPLAASTPNNSSSEILGGEYKHSVDTLKQYLSLINVEQVKKTSLVEISATSADKQLSALVANAHARAFIELVRSERQNSTMEDLIFLEAQADELAKKVALAERKLATYAEEHEIVSLNKDENITVKKMELLNQLLTNATAERIQAEMTFKEAQKGNVSATMAFDSHSTTELRASLKEAEAEYAMLAQKFKPGYPRMAQLQAKVETLKENLKSHDSEAILALDARYQAKLDSEKSLREQLEVQQSKAFELSRLLVSYNIMEREYESVKDLHQSVLRQLKEAQVSAQSSGTSVAITEPATVPGTHSSPKRVRNMLLALLFGPLIGFALAVFFETLDNTLQSPKDVADLLDLPTLGVVPLFGLDSIFEPKLANAQPKLIAEGSGKSDTNSEKSDNTDTASSNSRLPIFFKTDNLVTVSSPRSVASEAFRSIRTALQYSSADNPPKVLVFTSGQKGEGKTTLISNLAVTLAQASLRTILIDADLRRPSLHTLFEVDPGHAGLSELLTAQCDLEDVVIQSKFEHLKVIPAGVRPPNPAELVGSKKMADLLKRFSAEYDYVLIDTPPILPVADALSLARSVDGVVLVVRGQDTQKHVASLAVHRLDQVGARIVGVILNNVDVRSDYYYYYRDGYAYHYGHDDQAINS